jgi:hypothetical protein
MNPGEVAMDSSLNLLVATLALATSPETGERSRDGSVWEPYFDIVLRRVRH